MNEPACSCHDEPMLWSRDSRYTSGGYWHCRIRQRELDRARGKTSTRLESQRRYRTSERGRVTTRARELRHLHTPHGRAAATEVSRRRRARKAGVPTDGHTRAEVWERNGGVCQICFTKLDPRAWHEDHIIPLARGGADTLENVQAACPPCNLSKGARVA